MRVCLSTLIYGSIIVCSFGCKGMHTRPTGVPSSAVWVDNTFVYCSVESHSKANRCTVYKDATGEILADGLFVLNTSREAADKSELHYAAFGEKGIYLDDSRILFQREASERDPSNHIIIDRLKSLASRGGTEAIHCSNGNATERSESATECALKAFADRRPFYVRYYVHDLESFSYTGFAGNADGSVYAVVYSSRHIGGTGELGKEWQLLDGDHTLVIPCPKPITLNRVGNGTLTCAHPVS
jgi:hypothetical protein